MPRTPPSLKWLIDRRGRIDGEIKKIERSLAKCQRLAATCQQLADQLEPLKDLLYSIDKTLSLHDIQIDPALIPSIWGQDTRIRLPHGELTRSILECFRFAEGRVISSGEILDSVSERLDGLGYPLIPRGYLAQRIKVRLRSLYHEGCLIRHHDQQTTTHGLWSLAVREFSLDIQSQGDAPAHTP